MRAEVILVAQVGACPDSFLHRASATARGLAAGAAVLVLSLVFRSLDHRVCAALPLSTQFLWHLLNGLMRGWMIEVWRRHVAIPPAGRQIVGRRTS